VLPSSSYKERSKFPDGLKATETATCPRGRIECEMCREAMGSEMGLQNINGVGEKMVCFGEGESGSTGLMEVAIGGFKLCLCVMIWSKMTQLIQFRPVCFASVYLHFLVALCSKCSYPVLGFYSMNLKPII
jgi:hypothetical protein